MLEKELKSHFLCAGMNGLGGEDQRFLGPKPEPKYSPHRTFQPTHVELHIQVDVKKKKIEGVCHTKISILDEKEKEITFNAVNMKIENVSINNKKTKFEYNNEKISIPKPKKFTKGTITIQYSIFNPELGVFFIHPTKERPDKPFQAWTHSQTSEARYWYPCQDQPETKCPIDLYITVEEPFKAISNGTLVKKIKAKKEKEWNTFVWKFQKPNPPYLNAFMIGDFVEIKDQYKKTDILYYCQRGREKEAKRSFENTPKIMKFFSEYTAYEYPHEKYAQVAVADFIYGGMEHTTCTTQTDKILQDEIAHNEYSVLPELLTAHELAHQWFGNLVTCKDWSHGWLNEGFATFLEMLWTEKNLGKNEFDLELYQAMQTYLEEDKNRYRRPIVSNQYTQPEDLFDRHLYEKGAIVLNMLRYWLGEEPFKKAVSLYLHKNENKTAETNDFLTAVREATGKNATKLFDQWIYGTGFPELKISMHYDQKKKQTNIRVIQTQKEIPFEFPATIAITTGKNKIQKEKITISKKEHRFSFQTKEEPKNAVFDSDCVILKNESTQKPREWWNYQLINDPNCIHRFKAAEELSQNPSQKEIMLMGKEMKEDPFWGTRAKIAQAMGNIPHLASARMIMEAYEKEKNHRAQRSMIYALEKFQYPEVRELLLRAIKREDSYIIPSSAFSMLGKNKTENDLELLKKGIKRKSWANIIATGAIAGMASIQNEEAFQTILELTQPNYSNDIRIAAVTTIGKTGKGNIEKAVQKLEQLTEDHSINIQLAAIEAIGNIGDERIIPTLEKFTKGHLDGRVKRTALESIRKINGGQDLSKYEEEKEKEKK